jgi:hypothetical protein
LNELQGSPIGEEQVLTCSHQKSKVLEAACQEHFLLPSKESGLALYRAVSSISVASMHTETAANTLHEILLLKCEGVILLFIQQKRRRSSLQLI